MRINVSASSVLWDENITFVFVFFLNIIWKIENCPIRRESMGMVLKEFIDYTAHRYESDCMLFRMPLSILL